MKSNSWYIISIALVLVLGYPTFGANQDHQEGKLLVKVVVGDLNEPMRDAVVYVHGYLGRPSGVANVVRPGLFEMSLQPGVYDVFVGESSTLPVCKRIEIKPDDTRVYTIKLEPDLEHLQN